MHRLGLAFVVLTAACGGGGGDSKADGGTGDGGGGDGSASTPVTISIHARSGVAVAGVRVHFQNPDSTLVTSQDTDANGVASAVMPNGGFVTAIDPFTAIDPSDVVDVRTFAGVKGGDALVLDQAPMPTTVTVNGAIDASPYVNNYTFRTPCSPFSNTSTTPTGQLPSEGHCVPTTSVFEASYDVNGLSPIHWGYLANVDVSGATIDATSISVNNDMTPTSYTFANNPYGNALRYNEHAVTSQGIVASWYGDPQNPTGIAQIPGATDLLYMIGAATFSKLVVGDFSDTYRLTYTVDVGSKLLRAATASPMYDAANHRLVWTEASSGLAADWAYAVVTGFRDTQAVSWSIAAPASTAAVQFPTLPNEGTDYNWSATDNPRYDDLILGKTPGGYDVVRAHLLDYPTTTAPNFAFGGQSSGTFSLEIFNDLPQMVHGKR